MLIFLKCYFKQRVFIVGVRDLCEGSCTVSKTFIRISLK